jgi:hypothetical protein
MTHTYTETRATPEPVKATLVSHTQFPLETLYYVWQQSKHNGPMISPADINRLLYTDPRDVLSVDQDVTKFLVANAPAGWDNPEDCVRKWKRDFYAKVSYLIDEEVPCGQNLDFVFQLENVPVAFREQVVRHKVGAVIDDRIGFDTVPDQSNSAFWAVSHRVLDMSKFYDEGQWYLPASADGTRVHILGSRFDKTRDEVYVEALRMAQEAYAMLVKSGMPEEEARNVLPMAVTHRMTWKLNLVSLKYIIGKRTCWIMQRGFWESLIQQMVGELTQKVHVAFARMVNPPCIHGKNGWRGCVVRQSNMDRIDGKDPNPPCPLFLRHHEEIARMQFSESERNGGAAWYPDEPDGFGGWDTEEPEKSLAMARSRHAFREFWQRDVDTGEPLSGNQSSPRPTVAVTGPDAV